MIPRRQKGRLQAKSIINCDSDKISIEKAIEYALSKEMHIFCENVDNPYGDGTASEKIAKKIIEVLRQPIDLKKHFYNYK